MFKELKIDNERYEDPLKKRKKEEKKRLRAHIRIGLQKQFTKTIMLDNIPFSNINSEDNAMLTSRFIEKEIREVI